MLLMLPTLDDPNNAILTGLDSHFSGSYPDYTLKYRIMIPIFQGVPK